MSLKEHHTLSVIGLLLLLPVFLVPESGVHAAGLGVLISGLIRWWYSGNTETYRVP